MKVLKFNFYSTIITILLVVIFAAAVALMFSSCELLTQAIPPIDHPVGDDPQDTTDVLPIDTIDTDTIIPVEQDTCESFIEHTTPAFSTLYVKFDTPQDSVLWEGGGIQSYSLSEVVDQITPLQYKAQAGLIGGNAIIEGTNNHQQYQLKIFTKIDNAKWYMGTAKQGMILPGSDAAYFKETMHQYESYNQFSFYGVDCTCEEGVQLTREVLKDCHGGRWYADLFFLPCQPPQSVRDSLELYGWNRIRALRQPLVIDLRDIECISDELLAMYASTGAQIIVND